MNDGNYTNARFLNNIILQEDEIPLATNDSRGVTFGNNIWSKTPPSDCRGSGDIIADPKLAKTGPTGPGSLKPEWFKILENSPAKDRAKVLSEVIEDFFRTPRGNKPDIGAIELPGGPSALSATASGSPTQGQAPLTVNFTGSANGGTSPYSYNWNFGDGSSSASQNPSHTYSSTGTYTATLTVTDSADSQASKSVTINVVSDKVIQNLLLSATTGNPAPGSGGTTDPAPGTYSYPQGSLVSLRTIPKTNYRFSVWKGNVLPADAYNKRITVNMDRDKSLSANFCTRCGDTNGDLNITGYDAQTAFEIFLDRIPDPPHCQLENADVDSNSTITPADAQAIFNKYLDKSELPGDCSGKTRAMATRLMSVGEKLPTTLLIIEDVRVNNEGYVFIPIIIDNAMNLDAFGFDLIFPSNFLKYLTLESAVLTQDYNQLDGNVINSPASIPEITILEPNEVFKISKSPFVKGRELARGFHQSYISSTDHQILRAGGYKTSSHPNPSSGVLLTLVFRITEEFKAPILLSIITTYDDIQNASVIDGMIYPRTNPPTTAKERMNKKNRRRLPV
ncbi:MAG: PKD domain-containing protein [Candidatus Aminicenantes bacterium]|nr:MAG: PKD domain-containing protein [Candidatus Aminicenantes bacterium]